MTALWPLIAAVKAIGGPGSIGFFVVFSVVALLIGRLGGRWRKLSRTALAALTAGYLVLSLPPVANGLAERLTSYQPLTDIAPLTGVKMVVVLDGDNRRGRVREAKRLFDGLHPERVVVSGERWMLDALIEMGLPHDRIVQEFESRNTREQIEFVRRWPPRSVVLVASRFQMPRIAALLGPAGDDVYLAPALADTELSALSSIQWLIPRYSALRISRDVLYELVALQYYRRAGYTVGPKPGRNAYTRASPR